MKKVLIITYYWPPAGGPGVQRVLKYAKYLPQFGWQPVILTVRNGEFFTLDKTLENDVPDSLPVFKTNSIEPNIWYKKFVGLSAEQHIPDSVLAEENTSWKKRLAAWVRLNLFIPDAKIGWKPFAVKTGKKIIREMKPQVIFSSSPPPTVHLIARTLSAWSGIPWLADFRDPWTKIHYYGASRKSGLAGRVDRRLEQKVLQTAHTLTAVSPGFFDAAENERIHILPNGFDRDDLKGISPDASGNTFVIRYMGSLSAQRYVETFFTVMKDICAAADSKREIRIEFIGVVNEDIKQKINEQNIDCPVDFRAYLSHKEVLETISRADLLLLFINRTDMAKQILSGKVFEYLMVQKPVLAFGPPDGASDKLLQETGAGKLFDYDDYDGARRFIEERFAEWKSGKEFAGFKTDEINKYDRRTATQKLSELFTELTR